MYIIYRGKVGIYKDSQRVGHCEEGGYFGELAFDKQSLRTADAIAEIASVLFQISEFDYSRIIYNFKNLEKYSNHKVFMEIPMLSNISIQKLQRLINSCAGSLFAKGEIIYEQGNQSQLFYILKSGTVELQIYAQIEKQNKWPIAANLWNVRKVKSKYVFPLKVVESGGFFGEFEIVNKKDRETRAVALEDCVCLCLTKHDYMKHVSGKDQSVVENINKKYQEEIARTEKRFREKINKSSENHSILSRVMDTSSQKLNKWKEALLVRKKIEKKNFSKRIIENVTKNQIRDLSNIKVNPNFSAIEPKVLKKRCISEIPKISDDIRAGTLKLYQKAKTLIATRK